MDDLLPANHLTNPAFVSLAAFVFDIGFHVPSNHLQLQNLKTHGLSQTQFAQGRRWPD